MTQQVFNFDFRVVYRICWNDFTAGSSLNIHPQLPCPALDHCVKHFAIAEEETTAEIAKASPALQATYANEVQVLSVIMCMFFQRVTGGRAGGGGVVLKERHMLSWRRRLTRNRQSD